MSTRVKFFSIISGLIVVIMACTIVVFSAQNASSSLTFSITFDAVKFVYCAVTPYSATSDGTLVDLSSTAGQVTFSGAGSPTGSNTFPQQSLYIKSTDNKSGSISLIFLIENTTEGETTDDALIVSVGTAESETLPSNVARSVSWLIQSDGDYAPSGASVSNDITGLNGSSSVIVQHNELLWIKVQYSVTDISEDITIGGTLTIKLNTMLEKPDGFENKGNKA